MNATESKAPVLAIGAYTEGFGKRIEPGEVLLVRNTSGGLIFVRGEVRHVDRPTSIPGPDVYSLRNDKYGQYLSNNPPAPDGTPMGTAREQARTFATVAEAVASGAELTKIRPSARGLRVVRLSHDRERVEDLGSLGDLLGSEGA